MIIFLILPPVLCNLYIGNPSLHRRSWLPHYGYWLQAKVSEASIYSFDMVKRQYKHMFPKFAEQFTMF